MGTALQRTQNGTGEDVAAPKTGGVHVTRELLICKAYLYPYSTQNSEESVRSISQSP